MRPDEPETSDPLAPAELAAYLAELFPGWDLAEILRKGADVVDGELGELLAATAAHIGTQEDPPYDPEANICIGCPGCHTGGRCVEDPPEDDWWDGQPDPDDSEPVRPIEDVPTRGLL